MQIGFDGLDGLLSVHGGGGRDDDSFEARVLEHLVVVGVDCAARGLEVLAAPGYFTRLWCKCCDELGAGGQVEEVEGVTGAHAAEAGDGHLELALDHCGCRRED